MARHQSDRRVKPFILAGLRGFRLLPQLGLMKSSSLVLQPVEFHCADGTGPNAWGHLLSSNL